MRRCYGKSDRKPLLRFTRESFPERISPDFCKESSPRSLWGKAPGSLWGKTPESLWGKTPGSLQGREFDGYKFFKLRFGSRNSLGITERLMPKLQSSFCRIASAGLVKKTPLTGKALCRFATVPEQPWDNGAPNAKASIQLLPDCFRWIGEKKRR